MRKPINLRQAMAQVTEQSATEITVAELVDAYAVVSIDGTDLRLRKWLEHGYSPASVNRDLSSLGSVYRWAKQRRLSPRGFISPTIGVRRFEERIRRVHVEDDQIQALRTCTPQNN